MKLVPGWEPVFHCLHEEITTVPESRLIGIHWRHAGISMSHSIEWKSCLDTVYCGIGFANFLTTK